jgi:hypothetical protein
MASILGYTVTSWPKGVIKYPTQRIGTIQPQPGFDGIALAQSGWVIDPLPVQTLTRLVDFTAADALCKVYHALHAKTGRIVDQFGRTFDDVTVMAIMATPMNTIGASLVIADWVLIFPTTRPA